MKSHPCFIGWFQAWSAIDKLDKLWCVEYGFIEDVYRQAVKLRGIYLGHEILQVSVGPTEIKYKESGLDGACRQTRTSAFPVGEEMRPFELKEKLFEADQCGNASDHRLG